MPLYEYACTSCDRQFEVMQRFADDPLTICETCGGALKKLLSAPAFQFKGSGWYVTDYANKSGDSKKNGGASDGGSSGDSSETKGSSDAKASGDAKTSDSGKASNADKASTTKGSKASGD